MYIESSSSRTENDAAYFQTYGMPASDYCIDMSYHMFGVSVKLRYSVDEGFAIFPSQRQKECKLRVLSCCLIV